MLGMLLLAWGPACGQDEVPPASEALGGTPATQARPLGLVGEICADFRVWGGSGKSICKSRGTDPGVVLQELEEARPGACELLFGGNPTGKAECMNTVARVYAEGGTGSDPVLWLQGANSIQRHFRLTTNASMPVYENSLLRLEQIAKDIVGPSERSLEDKTKTLRDARQHVADPLKARATADKGAASAEAASQRERLAAFQRDFTAYKSAVDALQPEFSTTLTDFLAYRAQEAAVIARLQDLAQRASAADLNGIGPLQLELVALAREESARPQDVQLHARRLIQQLASIEETHLPRLVEHAEFLTQHTLSRPDLTRHSAEVLQSMGGYTDARYARVAAAVKKLLEGLRLRREALVVSQSDETTRQSLANAATLKASEDFLAEANARTQALWKLPPRSSKLKLFFLAQKHVDFESILQLEPVCLNATPWMDSGCVALRRQFGSARGYLNTTLPNMVRSNIVSLRRSGVSENLLKDIEKYLTAANLRQAVIAHDVALRASDL
ncbi:hypothetical protein [Archangium primigenium]|uniref:hypothetical protein n=1 Tax=[Archangium] primigenium TaxID=2792470 RepID=UPI00195DA6F6|nr:hypothetical protein [Archangium primigenium]MBM7112135.1 hypothetical protein [Archangium primigenium]